MRGNKLRTVLKSRNIYVKSVNWEITHKTQKKNNKETPDRNEMWPKDRQTSPCRVKPPDSAIPGMKKGNYNILDKKRK